MWTCYCMKNEFTLEAISRCRSQFTDPTWSVLSLEYSRSQVPLAAFIWIYEVIVKVVDAPDDFGRTIPCLISNKELLICYDLVTFNSGSIIHYGLVSEFLELICRFTNWTFQIWWNIADRVKVDDFTFADWVLGWCLNFNVLDAWSFRLRNVHVNGLKNFILRQNFLRNS